jgi:hypothetical protein
VATRGILYFIYYMCRTTPSATALVAMFLAVFWIRVHRIRKLLGFPIH